MLSAPTGCATEDIRRSIVHTTLSISTCKAKRSYTNKSRIWIQQSSLIIDELSIIHFELLATINKLLRKAQNTIVSSIALFGCLFLVVFIGSFYQFVLIKGCALWDSPCSKEEIYEKVLKDNF